MASRTAKEKYMSETAKVLSMDIPLGQAKPYLIEWRKKPGEHHKEVQISVSRQDSVQWYCDKKFRVVKVDRHNDEKAPLPLFYRRFPEDNEEFAFQVNSGPAQQGRENHTYKATFEFEDHTTLDPHIRATP